MKESGSKDVEIKKYKQFGLKLYPENEGLVEKLEDNEK